MVRLTTVTYLRAAKPDKFWKKRQVLKLTAKYYGRKRNCYSIAVRALWWTLQRSVRKRQEKHGKIQEVFTNRIDGASQELGITATVLLEGLARQNIALDRKTLSTLALWEPRTFESLTKLACFAYLADPPMDSLGVKQWDIPEDVDISTYKS